jgi:hypothetical protein
MFVRNLGTKNGVNNKNCNQELISKNTKVLNYPDPKTKAGSNLNNKIYLLK